MPLTYVESAAHRQNQAISWRRNVTIGAVALLHVAMFYVFTHGFNAVRILVPSTPVKLVDVPPEIKPSQPLPKPEFNKQVDLSQPPVTTTEPVVRIETPMLDMPSPDPGINLPITETSPPGAGPVATAQDEPLRVLYREDPAYPASARRADMQGTAVLSVTVAPDGRVSSAMILQSSGSMELDDAALAAVKRWRFSTHASGTLQVKVPISFRLQHVRF